jgi:hypothetical protein
MGYKRGGDFSGFDNARQVDMSTYHVSGGAIVGVAVLSGSEADGSEQHGDGLSGKQQQIQENLGLAGSAGDDNVQAANVGTFGYFL